MPFLFVGALAVVVAVLFALATYKVVSQPGVSSGNGAATTTATADGKVRVDVWIPDDAQAQIGSTFLPHPGAVRVYPGRALMEIYFDDGRALNCTFDAKQGVAVRYVGGDAISVNDGPSDRCIKGVTRASPPR